jgi:alkylhydroperoxidase family enzyme
VTVDGEGWIEHERPRVSPGSGRELGLFARLYLPIVRRASKGRTVNIFATLGRQKRLFRPWLMFAMRLMPFGTLPRDEAELVILRTAVNCRARYEWEQHQALARRAGLSGEEVERVREGPEAAGWSERRAAILAAVDELHRDRVLSDSVWERAAAHLSEEQMLELCMLTGHYEMLAMTLNSAGTPLDPGVAKNT